VAQDLLQEAVALDSTFAMAHRALAVSIANYGGDREVAARAAAAAFRHRARLPEGERLVIEASYYSSVLGDERRAIDAHRRLLALDSTDAFTATNLSDALLYAGEYEEAVRVLASTPVWTAEPYTWNLTVAYAALNQLEAALSVRDTAELLQPDDPYAVGSRAILLAAEGEIERARAVLAEGPRTTYAAASNWELYLEGVVDALSGRLEEASAHFARADLGMARNGAPSDRLILGIALPWTLYWIAGDRERAGTALEALLNRVDLMSLSPFNREYPLIALTYALMGDQSRASEMLSLYRSEAAQVPDPVSMSRARIAEALLGIETAGVAGLDSLEVAVGAYRCARCRDFFLGHGFERADEKLRAIEAYERFLAHPFFDTNDFITHGLGSAVHERLGRLYDAVGNRAMAAEHYRRLADLWAQADEELQPRVRFAAQRAEVLARGG